MNRYGFAMMWAARVSVGGGICGHLRAIGLSPRIIRPIECAQNTSTWVHTTPAADTVCWESDGRNRTSIRSASLPADSWTMPFAFAIPADVVFGGFGSGKSRFDGLCNFVTSATTQSTCHTN